MQKTDNIWDSVVIQGFFFDDGNDGDSQRVPFAHTSLAFVPFGELWAGKKGAEW